MLARVVAAADEERARIERELHDGVQQHLVALAVNAQLARELAKTNVPAALEVMEEVARDARAALEAVRTLAARIYPPLLSDRGLAEALRGAAAACTVPTRIDVDGLGRYPPEIEAAAYFCCLESLDAVAAYADALRVRAWQEDGVLLLEVGREGELAAVLPEPLYLGGRLAALGGRFEVEGDLVTVMIPLQR